MRLSLVMISTIILVACIKVGPPQTVMVERSEHNLKRGEYLVESVAGCMDCHSVRDWSYYSAPIDPKTHGAGGDVFDEKVGMPGSITSPNITPFALGDWTDGEIIRAVTAGLSRDGTPLFPLMPYENYAHMSTEDVYAVVAYLRTLEPIEATHPERRLNFPLNVIVRTIPAEKEAPAKAPTLGTLEYGKYVMTIAGCHDCHTPRTKTGKFIMESYMAGSPPFKLPDGSSVAPANITPHENTGIGNWTKGQFVARFKAFDSDSTKYIPLVEGQANTFMPWTYYAGMTEEDLGSIFDYLQSIPAIENMVVKYPEQ